MLGAAVDQSGNRFDDRVGIEIQSAVSVVADHTAPADVLITAMTADFLADYGNPFQKTLFAYFAGGIENIREKSLQGTMIPFFHGADLLLAEMMTMSADFIFDRLPEPLSVHVCFLSLLPLQIKSKKTEKGTFIIATYIGSALCFLNNSIAGAIYCSLQRKRPIMKNTAGKRV